MVAATSGVPFVIRFDRPLLKLAAIGALSAALLLAGCGRKAGLDPPPNAAVPTTTVDGQPAPAAQPDGTTPPPKRRFFLDWLFD
jgi:Prokaryotic lipoprotein-attachment site